MKTELSRNSKYKMICKELHKIYGEKTDDIVIVAERYYDEAKLLCANASEGEKQHLLGTILPTVAFYKALLEVDSENALDTVHKIMMDLCAKAGNILCGVTKVPGMKSLFMWLLPKMFFKMFGKESGFDYENLDVTKRCLAVDMTFCPYCKYAKILDCPELTPVFCDSDIATYGNLSGISFERTQTLGTGGEKCDFRFERKA